MARNKTSHQAAASFVSGNTRLLWVMREAKMLTSMPVEAR
jgi:hypothetical protein